MNSQIKATTARTLLAVVLTIVTLGAAAGFYAGLTVVNQTAIDVTHASQDAAAGGNQVAGLQELQVQLEQTRALVQKADTMFAPATGYQGSILTDLRRYATASGLTVTNTEFGEAVAATEVPAAGETRPVTITFAQPVSYTGLLRFLQLTEGSLPKITVGGIEVTRMSGDQVTVKPITLRISVK